jgi:two-component system phosphate regulon sensor histidine kinase PhoR
MRHQRLFLLLGGCVAGLVFGLVIGGVFGALIAGAAIAGFASTLLAWSYLVRPMQSISEAAGEMARGNLAARVAPRPSGPAGSVADTFNSMAEQVQGQMATSSQERSRLAAAMNSGVDAVAALDRDGRVLFANPGFEQLTGRPHGQIVGEPFAYSLADQHLVDAVRASRDLGERKVTLVERPGKTFLQVVTAPITGGGDWNTLVVCHDVTDVKRTEQVRRDFVANVSHELRTPLAAIKSVVETLEEGALADEAVAQEFLRRADQEIDRLVLLVEELLELSQIESGEQPLQRRETDIAGFLTEVMDRMGSQASRVGVVLTLDVSPEIGVASIDPSRMERAVINLIQNALKFTPPEGSVILSARRDGSDLVISVRDTGIGIDSRELPRIFERFYKVDPSRAGGGSGLGLALVKHAVEAHGGRVQVESRAGEGSVFSLIIPATVPIP